ncbi:MAG: hypothetical protein EA390_02355 [Balneolaceae bacterium]|nr:MAG: hypothetical protein EA390_02355 [Balneolaceae bacterium]
MNRRFVPWVLQHHKVKTFSVMSFLNPLFLIALLTVAVPLLIYLLNLRKPKRIRFSTLAFFESLKTTALKRIRLKRWLLLAIRMLAIIALVIAASRPFLPSGFGWANESEPKVIAVLIDNSPAMSQVDREGPYIEQALNIAAEVLEMADSDDRLLIDVTHGESMNTPFLTAGGALGRLGDIEPVNKGGYTGSRLIRLEQRLREAREPNKIIYYITSGQEAQLSTIEGVPGDPSSVNLQVLKVGDAPPSNTGFENVEVQVSGIGQGSEISLRAVLANYGAQIATNQFISFYVDGELLSQQPFSIEQGETEEFLFTLPETDNLSVPVELLIEGDELTFDNRFYAAIQMPELRRILVVDERTSGRIFNSYLKPLFDIASSESERFEISFSDIRELEVQSIYDYDAIVLDGIRNVPDYLSEALIDHVQAGAGLLFMPAAEGNMTSYNRLLDFSEAGRYTGINGSYGSFESVDRMAAPVEGHPVLESIFEKSDDESIRLNEPELFYYYDIEAPSGSLSFSILNTRTGRSLLQEVQVGRGRIIYSAIGSDPGWSNFPIKPFFAPLFFRTMEYLVQGEGAMLNNHRLGEPFRTVLNLNTQNIELEKDGDVIAPQIRQTFQGVEISYSAEEWTAGWLNISAEGKDDILYSVNQNAMESRLNTLDKTGIEDLFLNYFSSVNVIKVSENRAEELTTLQKSSFGREIWFWFIIAAILLLFAESLVSKIYKAETIT